MALVEVRHFFEEQAVDSESRVLVAFSGGADSLALLILLSRLLPNDQLHALYVNHRLRSDEELAIEEKLNTSNCAALSIPFSIVRLEAEQVAQLAKVRGNGIEEAARVLRYDILENKRQELSFDYIATAHTLDDQSETILMRLMQGSSPTALQGIAKRQGVLIRPLLQLTREDIEGVVKASGLTWTEDSTNSDTRYLRNRIRHELVPVFARLFPQYRQALDQVANRCSFVIDALQDQIDTAIAESVRETDDTVSLKLSVLEKASPIVVERVLYHGWNLLGLPEGMRLPYRNVQLIYNKISAGWEESQRMSVSGTILVRKNDSLVWQIEEPALAEGYVSCVYSDCIELDGTYRLLVGGEPAAIVPVEKRARIASESLTPPVVVRSYESGDAIRLVEGTKKVVSLFSDWHIAPEQRWRIPVLEDAKGIFAVLGGAYGGKDRVAVRCLSAPLARNHGTLYSVTDREG